MEKSDVYQKLAESWLIEKNLERFITVEVVHDEKFKPKEDGLLGKVLKAPKYWDQLIPTDVIIVIREDILDTLEVEYGINYRDAAFEKILNYISWDAENDKYVKVNPDVIEHSGILQKYGVDHVNSVKEATRQIQEKMEENS